MSRATDLAEADAQRAEAETDETDETETDETETTDDENEATEATEDETEAAAGPPSEQDIERALRALEMAGDDYTAIVAEIQAVTPLGLLECPLCPLPGFVPEGAPPEFDPLQRLAVLHAMGEHPDPPPPPHPRFVQCETCGGAGLMATGSHRAEFITQPCDQCQGHGYIDKATLQAQADARALEQAPPPAPPGPAPLAPATLPGQTMISQGGYTFPFVQGGSPDQVGRLAGHPLWGQVAEVGGL